MKRSGSLIVLTSRPRGGEVIVFEGRVKHRRKDFSVSNQDGLLLLTVSTIGRLADKLLGVDNFFFVFDLSGELPASCRFFRRIGPRRHVTRTSLRESSGQLS